MLDACWLSEKPCSPESQLPPSPIPGNSRDHYEHTEGEAVAFQEARTWSWESWNNAEFTPDIQTTTATLSHTQTQRFGWMLSVKVMSWYSGGGEGREVYLFKKYFLRGYYGSGTLILSKAAILHRNKPIFLRGSRTVVHVGWRFLKAFVTSHLSPVCTHFISFLEWGRGKGVREAETDIQKGNHLCIQGLLTFSGEGTSTPEAHCFPSSCNLLVSSVHWTEHVDLTRKSVPL